MLSEVIDMSARVKPATGRATCRVCQQKIKKGQIAIELIGYQFSQQVHSSAEECMWRDTTTWSHVE